MQTKSLLKKGLAVGIILLFIGVAVAPRINFNVVKAFNDNDLVEVTSQAYGIQGFGNTTVKLTKQQFQNLEQYLADFRARLNQTTTREEAVPIFKEAVVELNKYGLLPKGMSIKQAQTLATKAYQDEMKLNFKEKLLENFSRILDNTTNVFCLIAGHTTITRFIPFLSRVNAVPLMFALAWAGNFATSGRLILSTVLLGLSILFGVNFVISYLMRNIIPLSFSSWIRFGEWVDRPGYVNPADGWLFTLGLNGMKTWNHSFRGAMGEVYLNIGVIDFIGIKIYIPHTAIFLGSALWVKIEEQS
jgi:hypothetical protein